MNSQELINGATDQWSKQLCQSFILRVVILGIISVKSVMLLVANRISAMTLPSKNRQY